MIMMMVVVVDEFPLSRRDDQRLEGHVTVYTKESHRSQFSIG